MSKKKSPSAGYSLKEIEKMERGHFVLQFGGDFVAQDGFFFFTEKEINKIYNNTLDDLLDIIENGSEKDKKYAIDLIAGLMVKPARIH